MGLMGFLGKQFVDVIQWTEEEDGILAMRYPMRDLEIQNGASLTVRDTQVAVFVDEGKIADIFEPGHYKLTTKTLPVLTYLKNWDKLFESPFKSDVYFYSTRLQMDRKWGTPTAIALRDKEFGPLRIRAYGTYSFRLANPKTFYTKVSGTRETYRVEDLEGQLRSVMLTEMATFLGKSEVAFLDMAASQANFSSTLQKVLAPAFSALGLELHTFLVNSISLPDELQGHLDSRSGMGLVGDLNRYIQFETAKSISAAASNPGGLAGAAASLGAGTIMGQAMAGALGGAFGSTQGAGESRADSDPIATLNRLHELVKAGALTQAEFDAKKAELLKKIK